MNREYGLLAVNHQRLRSAYDYAELLLPKNDFTSQPEAIKSLNCRQFSISVSEG